MKFNPESIAEIRAMNANGLAFIAGVSNDNDAANDFLCSVRDSVLEATDEIDTEDWDLEMVDNYSGRADEIADAGPSIYTWEMWSQFIGLRAWQEDISDLSGGETDMQKLAQMALYVIAERLVRALAERIAEEIEESEG